MPASPSEHWGGRRPDRERCAYALALRLPAGTCPRVGWRSRPCPVTACARVMRGGSGMPACGGTPCYRILTARAANSTRISNEMRAWSIINSLAHRATTGVSVGDKAVLVVKARNK